MARNKPPCVKLDTDQLRTLTAISAAIGRGISGVHQKDKSFAWFSPHRPGFFVELDFSGAAPHVTTRHPMDDLEPDWPIVLKVMGFCSYAGIEFDFITPAEESEPPPAIDPNFIDTIGKVSGTA